MGGGSWSENRLLPDLVKSWKNKKILKLRNPNSTRPWQHVLDVLNGYTCLFIKYAYYKKKYNSIFKFWTSRKEGFLHYKSFLFFKKNIDQNLKVSKNKNLKFSETNKLNLNTNLTKKNTQL